MRYRDSIRLCGFCIILILTNSAFFCGAAEEDSELNSYADQIRSALASGQIDAIMKLIPGDLVIYDGSDYAVIREKFSAAAGDIVQAEVAEVTRIGPSLHRIAITIFLKQNDRVLFYFDVAGGPGGFRIADIYDRSELIAKEALPTLKSYASYENQPDADFPGFTYMQSSDADLTRLRAKFDLEKVAGYGGEINRIINLMQWVHRLVPHQGTSMLVVPQNSLNIIEVCQKENRGVNCRQLATVMNEVYLAMGFKSRVVTCLPAENEAEDCHVTNAVFSKALKKWIYMDPSFEAYFMDEKGTFLSPAEIRRAIIDGIPVHVNDEINWNGRPYKGGKTGYIRYMTKNMVRFNCSLRSGFGIEDKSPVFVELYPKGFKSCEASEKKTAGERVQCIGNPVVFWAIPED